RSSRSPICWTCSARSAAVTKPTTRCCSPKAADQAPAQRGAHQRGQAFCKAKSWPGGNSFPSGLFPSQGCSAGGRFPPGIYPFKAGEKICAKSRLTFPSPLRIMQPIRKTVEQEEYLVRSPFREPWMVGSRQRTFQRMDLRGQRERRKFSSV